MLYDQECFHLTYARIKAGSLAVAITAERATRWGSDDDGSCRCWECSKTRHAIIITLPTLESRLYVPSLFYEVLISVLSGTPLPKALEQNEDSGKVPSSKDSCGRRRSDLSRNKRSITLSTASQQSSPFLLLLFLLTGNHSVTPAGGSAVE